jgi:hypothetical protein
MTFALIDDCNIAFLVDWDISGGRGHGKILRRRFLDTSANPTSAPHEITTARLRIPCRRRSHLLLAWRLRSTLAYLVSDSQRGRLLQIVMPLDDSRMVAILYLQTELQRFEVKLLESRTTPGIGTRPAAHDCCDGGELKKDERGCKSLGAQA